MHCRKYMEYSMYVCGQNYLCVRTDVLEECGDLHGLK